LVTIGGVFALYFSSSGIESLRIGLNRAYELRERRSFWVLRLESIGFALLSAMAMSGRLSRMTLPMPMLAPGASSWAASYRLALWARRCFVRAAFFACCSWLQAGSRNQTSNDAQDWSTSGWSNLAP
jgi:membrane protein